MMKLSKVTIFDATQLWKISCLLMYLIHLRLFKCIFLVEFFVPYPSHLGRTLHSHLNWRLITKGLWKGTAGKMVASINTWGATKYGNEHQKWHLVLSWYVLGNCHPGKEEGSRWELALGHCTASRDLGWMPPSNFLESNLFVAKMRQASGKILVVCVECNKAVNLNPSHVALVACAWNMSGKSSMGPHASH